MEVDPNSWYHLTIAGKSPQSLAGTYPYLDGDTGLVTIASSNSSTPSQQWQLFSHNPTTYLLRTKASGPHGYLAISDSTRTCEDAIPIIHYSLEADESMLWTVQRHEGETYRLRNHAGGRICSLKINDSGTRNSSDNKPGFDQLFAISRSTKINDAVFSAAAKPPASLVRVYTPGVTTFASSTFVRSAIQNSTSYSRFTSSSTPSSTLSEPSSSQSPTSNNHVKFSPSAAMGVGVAVGIVGIIILLSITLLVYSRFKLQYSPSSQHYRQAKLWKGFTPATPSTARTTFVETKMANIYFAELPTPATPAFMLSPSLERDVGNRMSWTRNNRMSWQLESPPPPIELST